MSRHINLKNDKLVITFRFDPVVVAAIRTIDGRHWNTGAKHWEVPKENVDDVLRVLVPHGFTPHIEVKQLKEKSDAQMKEIEDIKNAPDAPYEGKLPLFDFQRKGVSFLRKMPCALLADVPGLGKTIQTIAALELEKSVLIFCPASLKFSWEMEIKKWEPDARIIVINGDKAARAAQWTSAIHGFHQAGTKVFPKYVIANYELLIHDYDIIKPHAWDNIVCDEATRISNPDAQSVKNLKTLNSKKRIALTGTPISNTPDDIYSIIDWLVPRYLGTFYHFRIKYCVLGAFENVVGYKNLEELSDKVNRFMLRRTKEEVFNDFPPKVIENAVFELSSEERETYRGIKELIIDEISKLQIDTRSLGIIPVKMLRLKQCTNHTELVGVPNGPSSKLTTLKDLLRPIMASGEKAIIFTQFSEMLHILCRELEGYKPFAIYGDVDSEQRMKTVMEFNNKEGAAVIIMTEAGAYGLNMQSASYVFHYDAPWSVAKLQQREDRAHRMGQKKGVTVYNMIARNTIDEYVMKVLHKKHKVSADILQDAERMEEAGLSKEDIDEILRL